MSLYKQKSSSGSSGFTIVELLIVIVIIAILVALVIVTYSGIQQQARNTQTIDITRQYTRAILLYAQDNGDYPRQTNITASSNACFGVGYVGAKCANTSATLAAGVGTALESTAFNTKISEYMNGKFPLPSLQEMMWNGQSFVGSAYWYGANAITPQVHYYLAGDVQCPKIGGGTTTRYLHSGNARCVWQPPALISA